MVLLEADIELLGLCLICNRFIHKSISFVPIFLCIFSLICGHGSFPAAFTWDITIRIFSETGSLVDRAEGSWVHLQAKFKAFPFVKVSTFAMRRKFCDNLGLFYLSKSDFLYLSISRFGSARVFILQVGLSSTPFPLSDLHLC